jgi:putative acetyltransferase
MERQSISVIVRFATVNDAEAILRAHYAAVHETAAKDYPQEILDEWSTTVGRERIEKFEKQLRENPDKEIVVVAEGDGQIVGFGAIVPANKELRAVYVSPHAGGKGLGTAILQFFEDAARKLDVPELNLDSSLTAEDFYVKQGYTVVRRGKHKLRFGNVMDCVHMKKELGKNQ